MAERPRRPRARDLVGARRHHGDPDVDRPSQPDRRRQPRLHRHDADRRRHGRPRLGARIPARQLPPQLPAVGMEHGLVRGSPPVPLLHGRARARDRRARRGAALRHRVQDHCDRGRGHVPARLLGVRTARQLPPSDPRTVRLRRTRLPARRELPDLRREPEVDDGRGVLVLDRPDACGAGSRSARQRSAHGQVPGLDRRRAVARRRVARHRADLRRSRRHRLVSRVDRPAPARLRGDGRRRDAAAVGVVGRAVPVRPRVHDRHEVRVPSRGCQRLVLRHVLPAHRAARLPGDHVRGRRVRGDGDQATTHRDRRRHHLSHVRRTRLRHPRQHPGHRPAVESATAAVRVPDQVPADGDRHLRGDRLDGERGQGSARALGSQRVRGRRGVRCDRRLDPHRVRLDVRDAPARRACHRWRHLGVCVGAVPQDAGRGACGGRWLDAIQHAGLRRPVRLPRVSLARLDDDRDR